jgi:hypothetical protein
MGRAGSASPCGGDLWMLSSMPNPFRDTIALAIFHATQRRLYDAFPTALRRLHKGSYGAPTEKRGEGQNSENVGSEFGARDPSNCIGFALLCVLVGYLENSILDPFCGHRCKLTPNNTNARRTIEHFASRAAGNVARIRNLRAESSRALEIKSRFSCWSTQMRFHEQLR